MKSRIVALFPGQGSQSPGMAKPLREHFPWTKAIYEEASDALGEDVLKLCTDGDEATLQLTRNAQPCILVTSYAWYQVMRKELDIHPAVGAGHSLGEYTALLASGAVSLGDATKLVRTRGEFMQTAVPEGKGKMAAVLGLTDEVVIALCEKATQGENSLVRPANFNAPSQVVIAGHAEAVDRAQLLTTTDPAFKARKVIPLKVSAPFHCPLMTPVANRFYPLLKETAWKALTFPIAFNLDGQVKTAGNFAELLRDQIDHPVLWTTCIQSTTNDSEPTQFIEAGPGKVLVGLVKRIVSEPKTHNVDSLDGLRALEKVLKEET